MEEETNSGLSIFTEGDATLLQVYKLFTVGDMDMSLHIQVSQGSHILIRSLHKTMLNKHTRKH